ncbi:DNA polymerase IV [Marinihelvus fidelis]|uniref:DNA polymerase IV n=1 Tax=Marinihelvus fidelis TaxID=2613842 RepID=A0A5N0TC58_9GAMM|nr:DNA polymerase IV [Marinihelvus fidelis]KAA9132004.1 DNA polymerase IV [Marinihelvus fidelis]
MSANPSRAIIHVDMDAFYASVEQHDDPELGDKAVIVGGLGPRGVVSAASYAARALGVRSAMPVAQARRLAPGATYLSPRLSRYREVSALVFEQFRRYTPLVEGLSLDEAFLDVTGSLKLFGSREAIGERIRDDILAATGLAASVGIAHNKFLAKLASDAEKPNGFVSVSEDRAQAFLDPMPVGRLWGIGKRTEPRLRAIGVLTIGQLRRADGGALKTVLGNQVGHFVALANGIDDREVVPARPDKSISHEITFDRNLTDERALRAELLALSEAVMRRVRKQHLAARTVHLKIRDGRFQTATRSLTLRAPTSQTRGLYQVGRSLLERWLAEHRYTPVRLLGIGVSGFSEAIEPATGSGGLDSAIDAITGRFGDAKLVRGLTLGRRPLRR